MIKALFVAATLVILMAGCEGQKDVPAPFSDTDKYRGDPTLEELRANLDKRRAQQQKETPSRADDAKEASTHEVYPESTGQDQGQSHP